MYKFLKSKAMFMCYLIICISFSMYLLPPVSAEEENMACCEMTKDGETCRYTLADQCDSGFSVGSFQRCEDSSFCKVGCCISPEGTCSMQVGRATCENAGEDWHWVDDPNCALERCSKGCCVLGESECSFTTERKCSSITSQFEGLELDFRASGSEPECTAICKQADRGCCVKNDGSCAWETRGICGMSDGAGDVGFYKDVYCSHDQLQRVCKPACEPHSHKGCIEGEEDVFWFDSCGNPEGVAEYCDYDEGDLCSEADEKSETAYCKSVDCGDTKKFSGERYGDSSINGPTIEYTGGSRHNGETWCYYDSIPGAGFDAVGSRHYRHMCINGEEIVEPCMDFREETCLQTKMTDTPLGTDFRSAQCIENNWEMCIEQCNSAKEIDDDEEAKKKAAHKRDKQCCIQNNCVWFPTAQPEGDDEENFEGECVPRDPPGSKFWGDDDGKVDKELTELCDLGDVGEEECNVKWTQAYWGADFKCVDRCECYDNQFLEMENRYCNSLGDCGAFFNYLGEWSGDGLYREWDGDPKGEPLRDIPEKEFSDYNFIGQQYMPEVDFNEIFDALSKDWESLMRGQGGDPGKGGWQAPTFGTMGGAAAVTAGILTGIELFGASGSALFGGAPIGLFSTSGATAGSVTAGTAAIGSYVSATVALLFFVIGLASGDRGMLTSAEYAGYIGGGVSLATMAILVAAFNVEIPVAGWIAAGIAVVIAALATLFKALAESENRLVTIDCSPWQAPYGGDNCELCDEDPMHLCSEYRCRSLGQKCKFIAENEGTGRETCHAVDINDIVAPIITPWLDNGKPLGVFVRDNTQRINDNQKYNVQKVDKEYGVKGYKINGELPAFSSLAIGIETNELAQCKFSTDFDKEATFSKLTNYFGDNYYKKQHNITIYGLTPDTEFAYYIICRDTNGNPKENQIKPLYKISFKTNSGPDLEPPLVIGSTPANNGYVSSTTTNLYAEFYVDEPNNPECKYSNADMDYGLMVNNMTCYKAQPNSLYELYSICYSNISVNDGSNTFYIRCKDNPDTQPNYNEESYIYTVTKSGPLSITSVSPPAGTEYFTVNATLQATTAGGAYSGIAICSWFERQYGFGDFFYGTNATYHEQRLSNLLKGFYDISINCYDTVGNEATASTNFTITADLEGPSLVAVYKDDTGVNVILSEEATCEYKETSFSYGTGTQTAVDALKHTMPLGLEEYHLLCKDIYNNMMPEIVIKTEISIL